MALISGVFTLATAYASLSSSDAVERVPKNFDAGDANDVDATV
jgi:hypothetical protein